MVDRLFGIDFGQQSGLDIPLHPGVGDEGKSALIEFYYFPHHYFIAVSKTHPVADAEFLHGGHGPGLLHELQPLDDLVVDENQFIRGQLGDQRFYFYDQVPVHTGNCSSLVQVRHRFRQSVFDTVKFPEMHLAAPDFHFLVIKYTGDVFLLQEKSGPVR
jgi:hypothetical protein